MVKEYEIVGLIPAAGSGSRLYPFSKSVPKELYPIMGKPVIEYCIENLSQSEIKKIFVVVGHQKGGIIDYLGNGSDFNVDVAYLNQHTRNGLGGAILEAEDWISNSFVTLLG
ncbi:NTP transferase domain-containing protein, partial [Candidatus Micrarchaeota archaeon]|nr:NTP transferase domain-containing protein [Candidatus Micrarchaeota archaeon]